MKVENYKQIKNQFIIYDDDKTIFHSYNSKICEVFGQMGEQKLLLNDNMWDYSNTTRKYFKSFINEETHFNYENRQQWIKEIENNENIEVL